ncbi:TIGR04438 family Trp-rich protein [Aquariibacter lacus]|nr:TIGR04438 family Trp-rich protein [Piscinibacter lacus]
MLWMMLGIVLGLGKVIGVSALQGLDWPWALAPFGLAALQWAWSDRSGRTARQAMDREAARRAARQQQQREALGLGAGRRGRRD